MGEWHWVKAIDRLRRAGRAPAWVGKVWREKPSPICRILRQTSRRLGGSRSFIYTPEGRRGLFTLTGGPAKPFLVTSLAAQNTDLALEFPLHLKDLFAQAWPMLMECTPKEQLPMVEAMASAPLPPLGISYKETAEKTSLRIALMATINPGQSIAAPGAPMPLPGMDAAIVIDSSAG